MRFPVEVLAGLLFCSVPCLLSQSPTDPQAQGGAGVAGSLTKDSKTGTMAGAGDSTNSREESATGSLVGLTAIAPAAGPPGPVGRPRIGLALGGG